jgi:hypothetical protein
LANKTQAKAVIDSAAALVKTDVDNLPVGVDISTGSMMFTPTRWELRLNATTQAAADTLATQIETALTAALRPWQEKRGGSRADDGVSAKFITITTSTGSYTILGF